MLQLFSLSYWLTVPVVAAPGALAWWWSRSLYRAAHAPSCAGPPREPAMLAEQWWAHLWRVSFTTTLSAIAVIAISGWNATWMLPCQFALLSISTHRTRRAMLGESWSWAEYVSWRLRTAVAFRGFWVLIAVAPGLVASASPGVRWSLAVVLAALAMLWHRFYQRVLLTALGATPLNRTDLDAAFQRVLERTAIDRPQVWRAGPPGGVFANAFAVPSLSGGAVLFFDTLLEKLERDEVAAILAHEVAHLEHYDRARLMRLSWGGCAAIPAAVVGSALLAALAPKLVFVAHTIWPLALFGALWARSSRMQGNETRSDVRAVELCGNAEALISALVRLYALNHVPRRFSARTEAQATHPSLAKRIRDIRAHTRSTVVPRLEAPLLLVSTESGRFAVLDRDAVSFGRAYDVAAESTIEELRQRASQIETLAYGELTELRLVPSHLGNVRLEAVDYHSRRRAITLQQSDLAATQTALDVVDQLLVTTPAVSRSSVTSRLTALISMLLTIVTSGAVAIVIPAVLLLARPNRAVFGALAGALAGAALMGLGAVIPNPTSAFLLIVVALLACWQLRSARAESGPSIWLWIERAAISLVPLSGIATIAIDARHAFDLHTVLRDEMWIVAGWISAMGYLAVSSSRAQRHAAGVTALIVTSAAGVASPWFLVTTGADPLVSAMAPLPQRTRPLTSIAHVDVVGEFASVRLSPSSAHFLVSDAADGYYEDDDEVYPRKHVVGQFDGWTRTLHAVNAALIDSDRVLILDRYEGGSSLRAESIHGGNILWTLTLPTIRATTLDVGRDDRWRVTETTERGFRRIVGRIGDVQTVEAHWSLGSHGDHLAFKHLADDGDLSLAMTARWEPSAIPWWRQRWRSETTLLAVAAAHTTPVATTRQTIDCLPPPLDTIGFVCIAFDGRASRVWRLDPQHGLQPVGWAPGFIWPGTYEDSDRVSVSVRAGPALMRLDTGAIDVLSTSPDDCALHGHAIVGEHAVTTCPTEGKTKVRLYRMNPGDSADMARAPKAVQ